MFGKQQGMRAAGGRRAGRRSSLAVNAAKEPGRHCGKRQIEETKKRPRT